MKYEFDADYKKMYLTMFNAATDAANELVRFNIGRASEILISAQEKCEDIFVDSAEDSDEEYIEKETDNKTESEHTEN
ncbi:MAG: hypothetical protein IKA10_06725 [Oscillospiraceae bacterium]|nr:hypothetical protein [Oscillospiraceae bacterium]